MMKLSELIQIAIEALDEDAQQELSFIAYPRHETRYEELKQSAAALRAIAPAVVEYVAASHCFLSMDADPDYHDRVQRYKIAWGAVQDALKEAGVSCE